MTREENELLTVVGEIRRERAGTGRFPTHSLLRWVVPRLKAKDGARALEIARRLAKRGHLKVGPTLNDHYIEMIDAPEQGSIFNDK